MSVVVSRNVARKLLLVQLLVVIAWIAVSLKDPSGASAISGGLAVFS